MRQSATGVAVTGWLMMRYRLKTLLVAGLIFCVIRFVIFSCAGYQHFMPGLWAGIATHGICYTLFFITGQIFLDRRVDAGMRGQMQGLLGLMTNGIGTLLGTLALKWLHAATVELHGDWGTYWLVLAVFTILCLVWFVRSFQEKTPPPREEAGS